MAHRAAPARAGRGAFRPPRAARPAAPGVLPRGEPPLPPQRGGEGARVDRALPRRRQAAGGGRARAGGRVEERPARGDPPRPAPHGGGLRAHGDGLGPRRDRRHGVDAGGLREGDRRPASGQRGHARGVPRDPRGGRGPRGDRRLRGGAGLPAGDGVGRRKNCRLPIADCRFGGGGGERRERFFGHRSRGTRPRAKPRGERRVSRRGLPAGGPRVLGGGGVPRRGAGRDRLPFLRASTWRAATVSWTSRAAPSRSRAG